MKQCLTDDKTIATSYTSTRAEIKKFLQAMYFLFQWRTMPLRIDSTLNSYPQNLCFTKIQLEFIEFHPAHY